MPLVLQECAGEFNAEKMSQLACARLRRNRFYNRCQFCTETLRQHRIAV
jgi:hypothetical protein